MTLLHVAGQEGRQLTEPANKVKEAETSTGQRLLLTLIYATFVKRIEFVCARSLVGVFQLQQPPGDSFVAPPGTRVGPGWVLGLRFLPASFRKTRSWELGAGCQAQATDWLWRVCSNTFAHCWRGLCVGVGFILFACNRMHFRSVTTAETSASASASTSTRTIRTVMPAIQ